MIIPLPYKFLWLPITLKIQFHLLTLAQGPYLPVSAQFVLSSLWPLTWGRTCACHCSLNPPALEPIHFRFFPPVISPPHPCFAWLLFPNIRSQFICDFPAASFPGHKIRHSCIWCYFTFLNGIYQYIKFNVFIWRFFYWLPSLTRGWTASEEWLWCPQSWVNTRQISHTGL